MGSRLTRLAVALACAWAVTPHAAALDVQLFPLTGEIRLKNPGLTPISFVLYSIQSPSGALTGTPSVWKSITDNYDRSGNRFIDPVNDWFKLSATATELSEGVVGDPGGVLPAMRSVTLGRVWNPHKVPFPDLTIDFRSPTGQPISINSVLALDGDYAGGASVDMADYNQWRRTFGLTNLLLADGNINGVVDAADYVVWRDNLGKTRPSPPFGAGGGTATPLGGLGAVAVPEPATCRLIGVCALLMLRRNRWLRRGPAKSQSTVGGASAAVQAAESS